MPFYRPVINAGRDFGGPVAYGMDQNITIENGSMVAVSNTGANEATTFEVSRDVKINGKDLPKGKYALFSILNGKEWTIIFNKTWNQWGAYKYKESDDALRVKVYNSQLNTPAEKLAFDIDDKGTVSLMWGDKRFILDVK